MCRENPPTLLKPSSAAGSSPRVRGKRNRTRLPPSRRGLIPACAGKHQCERSRLIRFRLIPACAGKTRTQPMNIEEIRAHPRVCGENYTENAPVRSSAGSSPRVRGKRECSSLGRIRCGLIPACAGKTGRRRFKQGCGAAHPRVCGENSRAAFFMSPPWGSSPRVRGKLRQIRCPILRHGLIPACAGKTIL